MSMIMMIMVMMMLHYERITIYTQFKKKTVPDDTQTLVSEHEHSRRERKKETLTDKQRQKLETNCK